MRIAGFEQIDRFTFIGALALLLLVTLPLVIWPEAGAVWVAHAKTFMTDQLGSLYLLLGLAAPLINEGLSNLTGLPKTTGT